MVVPYSVFWGTSIIFSILAAPVYIPTKSVGGCPKMVLETYNIFQFDFRLPASLPEDFLGWPGCVLPTVNVRIKTLEISLGAKIHSAPCGVCVPKFQSPTVVACLRKHILRTVFPDLPHFSIPWLWGWGVGISGVTSQINSLHLNAYLRLCFWGNPNQDSFWEWWLMSAELKRNKEHGICTFFLETGW